MLLADVDRFRDRISGPDRHEFRLRDGHHRASILGLNFETLKTLISGLAGCETIHSAASTGVTIKACW
jgi:hypothetical protein